MQGSNLGPLLFVIFYKNVVLNMNCRAFIYADDLKIAHITYTYESTLQLQRCIDKLI